MAVQFIQPGRFGGGATFSPSDLSGLKAWYDASDAATITSSGGAVSQWNDKSGNGLHLSQGTATNQPTTGADTKNGLNVLTFATDDTLKGATASDWNFLHVAAGCTVFVVAYSDEMSAAAAVLSTQSSSTTTGFRIERDDATARPIARVYAGSTQPFSPSLSGSTWEDPAWVLIAVRTDPDNPTAADRGGVWVNNSNAVSIANANTDAPSSANASAPLHVGSRNGTIFLNGRIAEIVMYDTQLTDSDMDLVETYLNGKWAIY